MSKEINVTVGQMYRNYKNKKVAKVVKVDETAASAELSYEEGGDIVKASFSSLNGGKSWKRIAETAKADKKEVVSSKEVKEAKKKLDEMLAPAEEIIRQTNEKAKAQVKAEIEAKQKAAKKAEAEEAERLAKAEAEEKAENELLARYQKDAKQKKQAKSGKAEAVKENKKAEKPKADKPKREKKPKNSPEVIDALVKHIIEYTEKLGGNIGIPREESMSFRALRKENRQFCKLMWSGKSVKLFSKIETAYPFKTINYNLPNQYEFINNDKATLAAIDELLKSAYKECAVAITRKKKADKEDK